MAARASTCQISGMGAMTQKRGQMWAQPHRKLTAGPTLGLMRSISVRGWSCPYIAHAAGYSVFFFCLSVFPNLVVSEQYEELFNMGFFFIVVFLKQGLTVWHMNLIVLASQVLGLWVYATRQVLNPVYSMGG